MKKFIIMTLASIGLMAALPISIASAAPIGTSYIAGTITSHGSPVDGANVAVTCDSNVLNSSTTVAGGYLVQFTSAQCPSGSTANVSASKGSASGSSSGTVNNLASDSTIINLGIVNVSIVPEFGMITGGAAIVFATGSLLVVRRKNLSAYKNK